jgi:hypothetical protein
VQSVPSPSGTRVGHGVKTQRSKSLTAIEGGISMRIYEDEPGAQDGAMGIPGSSSGTSSAGGSGTFGGYSTYPGSGVFGHPYNGSGSMASRMIPGAGPYVSQQHRPSLPHIYGGTTFIDPSSIMMEYYAQQRQQCSNESLWASESLRTDSMEAGQVGRDESHQVGNNVPVYGEAGPMSTPLYADYFDEAYYQQFGDGTGGSGGKKEALEDASAVDTAIPCGPVVFEGGGNGFPFGAAEYYGANGNVAVRPYGSSGGNGGGPHGHTVYGGGIGGVGGAKTGPDAKPYLSPLPSSMMALTGDPNEIAAHYKDGTKPPFSYASLIAQAILAAPDQRMTLAAIYQWIIASYPYYANQSNGWQNSIRHNLSLNKCFIKLPRSEHDSGKGAFWTFDATYVHLYENGFLRKRRVKLPSPNLSSGAALATSGCLAAEGSAAAGGLQVPLSGDVPKKTSRSRKRSSGSGTSSRRKSTSTGAGGSVSRGGTGGAMQSSGGTAHVANHQSLSPPGVSFGHYSQMPFLYDTGQYRADGNGHGSTSGFMDAPFYAPPYISMVPSLAAQSLPPLVENYSGSFDGSEQQQQQPSSRSPHGQPVAVSIHGHHVFGTSGGLSYGGSPYANPNHMNGSMLGNNLNNNNYMGSTSSFYPPPPLPGHWFYPPPPPPHTFDSMLGDGCASSHPNNSALGASSCTSSTFQYPLMHALYPSLSAAMPNTHHPHTMGASLPASSNLAMNHLALSSNLSASQGSFSGSLSGSGASGSLSGAPGENPLPSPTLQTTIQQQPNSHATASASAVSSQQASSLSHLSMLPPFYLLPAPAVPVTNQSMQPTSTSSPSNVTMAPLVRHPSFSCTNKKVSPTSASRQQSSPTFGGLLSSCTTSGGSNKENLPPAVNLPPPPPMPTSLIN